ncbi:4-hydroxy-tetrahydrodipicolinate reductase [Oribacterium sp. WCC10]|uniref:4-hydroxy-tetrahydrodipicolinate reductase n=1 Tax=Oribacterium sp. WCC10 TaxID=1855343 RepID=UPI0008EB6D33|nr:4-hydroxy-tetrahydrodipicolinate reductase [Oribacterium sp. WCC10]SFG42133.1 dihydrodipicolinate reductase [Oribacterium sp. WCC10]
MTRVLVFGAMGVMCRNVANCAKVMEDIEVVAGVDREDHFDDPAVGFPVYSSFDKVTEDFDVIIDFSVAPAIDGLLDYVEKTGKACVQCTTGLSEAQLARVEEISKKSPILRSANMSIGVNLILSLVKEAAKKLYAKGFDIDIVEQHHRRKQDAPSGTAVAIADAVNEALDNKMNYVYDRSDRRQARPHDEIGISAVRGGTIAGVHDIIFAGEDEVITFNHTAYSRNIFANGALNAAKFLNGKAAGLYSMQDVLA